MASRLTPVTPTTRDLVNLQLICYMSVVARWKMLRHELLDTIAGLSFRCSSPVMSKFRICIRTELACHDTASIVSISYSYSMIMNYAMMQAEITMSLLIPRSLFSMTLIRLHMHLVFSNMKLRLKLLSKWITRLEAPCTTAENCCFFSLPLCQRLHRYNFAQSYCLSKRFDVASPCRAMTRHLGVVYNP